MSNPIATAVQKSWHAGLVTRASEETAHTHSRAAVAVAGRRAAARTGGEGTHNETAADRGEKR